MYPNHTYGFASPTGLWKVTTSVAVECNWFLKSIGCFYWYKTSFKFFKQACFCWFLTCVYWIYWIIVHLSQNLSLSVIENVLWSVYKPDTHICFPSQDHGRSWQGCRFCGYTFNHQWIDWFQRNFGREYLVVKVWWFKTVFGIRDKPRVNKDHSVNTWHCFSIPP